MDRHAAEPAGAGDQQQQQQQQQEDEQVGWQGELASFVIKSQQPSSLRGLGYRLP
jgi:hypothetical protein